MTQEYKPKKKQGFLTILLGILAVSIFIYIAVYFQLFTSNQKNLDTAIKAYQLYAPGDKQRDAALFFGDTVNDGFKISSEKIFESVSTINQVKQVILFLLSGPKEGFLRLIPEGTSLREAYLDSNLICYLDFSREIAANHKGGTTGEYLTVYSIINTIFYDFPKISGVKILIDGKEAETLAGHIAIDTIFLRTDAARQPGNK